jgi:drug/metabolite transporter (DMT)-like permease
MSERIDAVAPNALRGDLYMIAGVMCASTFNVFGKRYLLRYGIMPVNVYCLLIGSSALFLIAMVFERPLSGSLDFDLTGWLIVFLLSVPGGALMMVSWGRALQLISPTQASVTVGLNPLVAIGILLLGEPPSLRVLIGFVLILAAIFCANYQPRRRAAASSSPGP